MARTLDISESGIRVELPEGVVVDTPIGVIAERLGLTCSGLVRNCIRCGSKYLVGVEFNGEKRLNKIAVGLAGVVPESATTSPATRAF